MSSQLFRDMSAGFRCIADKGRLQSGANESTAHGRTCGGEYHLRAGSFDLIDKRDERMGGCAVDQRHVFKIQHQQAGRRSQTLQYGQYARGCPEEKCTADAIKDDITVGCQRGIIALSVGTICDVFKGAPTVNFDRFSHSVQEKQGAEDDADGNPGDKIDEDRQQESREQHDCIAARRTQ